MQRDMDLIRRILLAIESSAANEYEFDIEGADEQIKWHNVNLLVQERLIEGVNIRWGADGTGPLVHLGGRVALTWKGHDFLDAVRDDSIWIKTKEKARARGLYLQSLTFDIVKSLSVSIIQGQLGL